MKTLSLTDTLNQIPVGCYIDASAQSAEHLNRRIIRFARNYGWTEEEPEEPSGDADNDVDAWADYSEALNDTADTAVDWLNEMTTADDRCWTVGENSLFLADTSEEI